MKHCFQKCSSILYCLFWQYRRSSDYDGLDLRYFEFTNAAHKNTKDNNIEVVKLDLCDQELQ